MQLVEQGKLALDDADLVERYCPELKTVRILKGCDENGKAETVAKKNRITLRMLLSHTGMAFVIHYLCDAVDFWLTGSNKLALSMTQQMREAATLRSFFFGCLIAKP